MELQHLPVSFLLLFLFSIFTYLPGLCEAGNQQFVFSGFGTGDNLTLDSAANVSGGLLELTTDEWYVKGHAFYRTPLCFKESPDGTAHSFSAIFVFAIIFNDTVSTDGMAFLVSPTTNLSDATGAQFMGFLDSAAMNHTFAVELDTIWNKEMHDIVENHVGIDIASKYSTLAHTAGYYDDKDDGTFHELNLQSGEAMQVWVDYDGKGRELKVTLAPMGVDKPSKPLLTNVTDLSAVLTDQAYVGFSAGTGPIKSRHCVLAWSFAIDGPAPLIDYTKMGKLPASSSNHSPNSTLSNSNPPSNSSPPSSNPPSMSELKIVLATAGSVLLLVAGVAGILLFIVVRRQKYDELREDWEVDFVPQRLSYKDLLVATEGFKDSNILGVGGFGKVYKGFLPKLKLEVAVKRVSHDSSQGIREFISEVVSIGRMQHRNLLHLHGYCRRRGELLLVYDLMENGSLEKHLYGQEGSSNTPVLEWGQRFRIVKDVAEGLHYLHEKWEKVVVHRDVKPSNVLLDRGMNARLGDFGLALLYDHGADLTTNTRVAGTVGYMAPEMLTSGKASPLTDVFAYGTLLLEVACGQRPVCGTGRKQLVHRVRECWRHDAIMETVDRKMRGRYDAEQARLVLTLGLMCSHPFPGSRPTMRQVTQYLDGNTPLPEFTPENLRGDEEFSLDQSVLQIPCSENSVGTMTIETLDGR